MVWRVAIPGLVRQSMQAGWARGLVAPLGVRDGELRHEITHYLQTPIYSHIKGRWNYLLLLGIFTYAQTYSYRRAGVPYTDVQTLT